MKTKQRSCLRAGPLLLLLAGLAPPVLGQTVSATVTGTVTDHTGAVVTKASVAAVHRNTGVEYPTQSNDAGVYTITGLPIGTYVVKAESPGFKSITTNPLKLEVGQIARVNLKLEVGAVTEEIQVTGVNPILQTENAVVGEIISGSTVVALPLNGRNFAQLALLAPGVQTHAPDTFTEVKTNGVSGSGRPYVNGQREQSNNFMLDGIDQNEAVDNLIAYYPSPDAIAEMKVDTNNYSAEYGNVAGGVVNVVTKSGSNEFHGSAFTFARDDKFDANSWANNRSAAKKGNFSQQIFGGTLGGPLARNKLFFFVDYQGTRINRPGDAVATVAPAEWRNGDFSSLLARGVVIRDPSTGLPFPGNRVPTSRFSPAARALLGNTTNYPLPNRPGVDGLTGNFVSFQDSQTRNHQGDLRIDANLSPSDNLSIRGSVGKYRNLFTQTVFPLRPGGGWDSDAQSVAVNWAHTWPSAVNELRVGWSHVLIDENPTANVFGLGDYNQALGIPGGQPIPGLSDISFGNSGIDGVGNAALRHYTNNKTFQISEKLSISRGRHFLSVGGQFLHYKMGQDYASNSGVLGSFQFNQNFTGFGFSDFLLDQVGQKRIGRNAPWTQLQNRLGVFVQDDLKVNSKLTLNLGLRWEYASPIVEADDKQVNIDIKTGEVRFAGKDGNSRALYDPYYGGFSPRLGFAWTANDKTVLRGGYGMVQYMEGTGANCRLPLNPPFFGEFLRIYTASPGSLATGFSDVQDLTNVQFRAWQTDLRPQLTQQWNVFFERRVSDTTSLNVGYVGSKSTRVVSFGNANQPLPGVGDPSTWLPDEQRRPLPQYGLGRYTASDAKVNYHGLQTSLRRRRANGLEFLASYTLSKTLTDNVGFYGAGWGGFNADEVNGSVGGAGNLNFRDKSLDYGPAWFSSKHTAVFSASYELPVGKGRKVGSDWSGVAEALLGGWNVSSILTVRSGLPITVVSGWGNTSLQSSSLVIQERPDRIGDGSVSNPSWDRWLDASAFRLPALGHFGTSGVGILRGPGFYNIDLGIDKNFDLGASRLLTLRIEAFNVLNHSNKGLPVRDMTDPRFGQILGTANRARVLEFAGKFIFD